MASGRALAIPTPRRPRPTSPAAGASTISAPPNPAPATIAPARNTCTAPKRETSLSPTRRPRVTAPRKTPRATAPRASAPPSDSVTYTADQFRPAPSASVKQNARAPSKAMEPDQSPNQRLNPPDPSSDRSSAAPNREGKSRGQAARPATTAATAHAKKCCCGAAPRRGKGARSCAEDAPETVHGVQPGEHRTAQEPLEGESLGVHRDVHDAVESGEREQARGQQE